MLSAPAWTQPQSEAQRASLQVPEPLVASRDCLYWAWTPIHACPVCWFPEI